MLQLHKKKESKENAGKNVYHIVINFQYFPIILITFNCVSNCGFSFHDLRHVCLCAIWTERTYTPESERTNKPSVEEKKQKRLDKYIHMHAMAGYVFEHTHRRERKNRKKLLLKQSKATKVSSNFWLERRECFLIQFSSGCAPEARASWNLFLSSLFSYWQQLTIVLCMRASVWLKMFNSFFPPRFF